jgi:hypothetical protein
MNGAKLAIVVAFTVLGMAVVGWFGYTYRNETVAFLRALVRALF